MSVPDLVPGLADPLDIEWEYGRSEHWCTDPAIVRLHVEALGKLKDVEIPAPACAEGDGVVTVGGGAYWPGIVVSVRMLRRVSYLPVQVWYRSGEESIDPADLAGVPGVSFHDLTKEITPPPRVLGGWQAKYVALLNCGYRRALFLDADAYVVSDPASLLDLASESRFVYWNDIDTAWQNINWAWYGLSSIQGNKPWPVQGGQFALDLLAFRRELVITHWLNQHSDYTYFRPPTRPDLWRGYGDQDCLRVALNLRLGPYRRVGAAVLVEPALVCSLDGQPMIVHRVQSKLGWKGQLDKTAHLPGDAHAFGFLEQYFEARERPEVIFRKLFTSGAWGEKNTCGGGSTAAEARPWLEWLNGFTYANALRSVVDLGCGDGAVTTGILAQKVIGVDVVPQHILGLQRGQPLWEWHTLDMDRDRERLPGADLAVVKDVLLHWPNALVRDWIAWAQTCGKWKAILYVQDCFQDLDGADCALGGYRGLDVRKEPLRGLPVVCVHQYNHKAVLLQIPAVAG